jgi:tripartite-type tricarboxylate transporter receptor subunit TctC
VVVDNRPGAGGTIGSAIAAKSPADGYTLLMTASGPHAIAPSLYKSLPYDLFRDYAPISLAATSPYVLLVHPSVGAASVSELIAWLKGKSAPATYSSAGNGTPSHLSAELFKLMTKVTITHVPYKGAAPAVTALIGGEVEVLFADMPAAAPQLKSGKVRALAVTTAARSALVPELPTMAETGLRGYESATWYGMVAPAGTPDPILKRLNVEIVRILKTDEIRNRFAALGSTAAPGTPAEFSAVIKIDYEKWARVVKAAGVTLE